MAILQNTAVVMLTAVLFLIITGAGALFLRAIKSEPEKGADFIIFSFASGAVLFSLVILTVGRAGFYTLPAMLIIGAVFAVCAGFSAGRLFESIKETVKSFSGVKGFIAIGVLLLALPRFISVFFNIFVPNTSWDTMAYHYAIPSIYQQAGQITYIPYMFHSNWPQNLELIFGWSMTVFNDTLAGGAAFIFAAMLLLTVFRFGQKVSSARAGIIAASIVCAFAVFKREAVNGYVDTGLAFYETAAAYGVFLYMHSKNRAHLGAAAFAAAGAASVKILGLFSAAFLPFFILLADYIYNGKEKKLRIMDAVFFGIIACLAAAPWYIKSFVDTGNPVWPFAYGIFGGNNWTKELSDFRSAYYGEHGSGRGILNLLSLPLSVITSKNMDGYAGNNFIFLYLMLPFSLYMAFVKKHKDTLLLLLLTACFLVFWVASSQFVRFLFPGLVIFTVLSAAAADYIFSMDKKVFLKILTGGCVLYLLLYSYPFKYEGDFAGVKTFAGIIDREKYLEGNMDNYKLFKKINADNDITGKIVFFREIRGYYLKKDYIWGDPSNQALIGYNNTSDTLKDLRDNGVNYVVMNSNIYSKIGDGYTETVFEIMNEITGKHSELKYCEKGVCLYKLIR